LQFFTSHIVNFFIPIDYPYSQTTFSSHKYGYDLSFMDYCQKNRKKISQKKEKYFDLNLLLFSGQLFF